MTYLRRSELDTIGDIRKYNRVMRRISETLAEFTSSDLNSLGFLHLAHDYFQSVTFCAASALGSAPEGGKSRVNVEPRRVIDPLLWIMEKSR